MSRSFSRTANKAKSLFLLLIAFAFGVDASPPPPIFALRYEATGFNEISNSGLNTIQISVSRDLRLIGDTLTQISVEIEPIGASRVTSSTRLTLDASQGEPCTFPLSIIIPDNDTSGVIVTVICGEFRERHQHYFASHAGEAKFFSIDPRQLNEISPGDPRHPNNQRRENTTWKPPLQPQIDTTIPDSGVFTYRDATPEEMKELEAQWEERRKQMEEAQGPAHPLPQLTPEQAEQPFHFAIRTEGQEQYKQAVKLFDKLQPMDSVGFYHGWAKFGIILELEKLKIPAKEYPHYPGRYIPDSTMSERLRNREALKKSESEKKSG